MKAKKLLLTLLSVICLGITTVSVTSCEEEHVHEWNEIERTKTTCTENGTITYLCIECEEIKHVVVEVAKGHTEIIDAAVTATCTTAGKTEGKHCSVCDEVLVTQEVIDAKGHTEVTDAAVAATCTTTGLTEGKHCSVCNEVLVKQNVVDVRHNYTNYVCNDCGFNYYTKGIEFTLCEDGESYFVSKYTGTDNNVVIPSVYNNLPVTSIKNDDDVFIECRSLSSVTIGNGVTSIYGYTFLDCSSLTSVTIGNSVKSIEYAAFQGCSSLIEITIPNSVMSIDDSAFQDCKSLTSVTIGNSVKSIGNSAFYKCSSLTSIIIPESVTSIRYGTFRDCNNLENVYYTGTEEQWNNITIDSNNDYLINATIIYNYKG